MKHRNGQSGPPRWADRFLRIVLREEDRDAISGDLLEEHHDVERASGRSAANARYFGQLTSVCAREARRRLSVKLLLGVFCVLLIAIAQSLAEPPVLPLREPMMPEHKLFLVIAGVGLFLVIAGTSIAGGMFVFLTMRRRQPKVARRV